MHYRRFLLAFTFVFFATTVFAQHPISVALHRLLDTGNFREASETINTYTINELTSLPDSTLFDYYYLQAAIKGNDSDETNKRKYLIDAKKLCEKSQGIHSSVYLEVCWALGKSFEENKDTLSAFEIYQAVLIQSRGLYSLKDEDVKWQYEEINNKVIEWYKNDVLRKRMIQHRDSLLPRNASSDTIQNDIEFYRQFYNDEYSIKLISKADSLMASSLWEEAAKFYIKIANTTLDNPVAKATLQELAAMNYINMEEFQSAEELLLNNIQILENYKRTKIYRRTLSQLSNLYNAIHNYSKAKHFAGEAKFWYEEALDFSRGYILCLHRCATLERGNNNYFLALLLEDVALQEWYRNNTWGSISGNSTSREAFLANLFSSAALHYNQVGFHKDAYNYIKAAIEIAESKNLDTSSYYNNMADICNTTQDFREAAFAGKKAYELSQSEINKITIGGNLCVSQFLAGEPISNQVLVECSQYLQSFVNRTFSFASMDERKDFWLYLKNYFPWFNFLAYQTGYKDLYGQIYNNILVEKGLLLRTANVLRDQILKIGCQEDIQIYNKLLQFRNLLPLLDLKKSESIKSEIERLDKYLTRKFTSYASFVNSIEITWIDVKEHLNDDDIAIEFYNIPEITWHEDGKDLDGKNRYCAITLRKGYEIPHIIPLFTDDRLQSIELEELYETDSIYNLIWKPLEEELNGVRNIYFSADRELHRIGIEYAPMQDGGIIGDRYNLYRLSSTRVLTENHTERRSDNAVLYGGLRYDIEKNDLIAMSRAGIYHPTSASRAINIDIIRDKDAYLPGSLSEVKKIAKLFSITPRLITDIAGTEESFKALAGSSIDIIHLATHGFFWNDSDVEKRNNISFLHNIQSKSVSIEDNAMIRSGLMFSGASICLRGEELPEDVEDGILTAQELSNMNLGHVDMVVMSACDSGLGEVSGEGVFGLQRGFKLAGASSLLMSLSKVNDDATRLLMTNFYKNYLSGKSKQESLRLAQKRLRDHPKYYAPKYWASFILLDALN